MPADPLPHPSSSSHHPVSGGMSLQSARGPSGSAAAPPGMATPPKAGPISKLRGGPQSGGLGAPTSIATTPKDTIPIAKTPRKQRSSRFHVTERVEIVRLPPFSDVPYAERHDLFVAKLRQCSVVFDFSDASTEMSGKSIKSNMLQEMLEYITTQRGVITEQIYPEVVAMVRCGAERGADRAVLVQSVPRDSAARQSDRRRVRPRGGRACPRAGVAASADRLRILLAVRLRAGTA